MIKQAALLAAVSLMACQGKKAPDVSAPPTQPDAPRIERAYPGRVPLEIPAGKTLVVIGQVDREQMHE